MFTKGFKIFSLFGFDVRIDLTWLLLFLLIAFSLATYWFPEQYGIEGTIAWVLGAIGGIALLISIVLHELTHSLIARAFGMPIHGITLFLFGGVAEMHDEPPSPKAEGLMAIGGPITSGAIGGIVFGIVALGRGTFPVEVIGLLEWIALLNIVVACFNLIPAFPLDGGRVLRAIIWGKTGNIVKATRIGAGVGQFLGVTLIILAVAQLLFTLNFIAAIWWFLLGLIINGAAKSAVQQTVTKEMLSNEPVRRVMSTDLITIAPERKLEDVVGNVVYRHHHKLYPVVDNEGRLVGCFETNRLHEVDRQAWPETDVSELVVPCDEKNTVSPEMDASEVLKRMTQLQRSRMIVEENGRAIGVVTLKDLMKFISLKMELEHPGETAAVPMRHAS